MYYNVGDDPSVQSGNATDALQNAPGVEVDAEGNIRYRGGAEVSIWINDKPSHPKTEGLKQYLKSLPAGTLQHIEVIAHPSAKYHTQNCVINIVTTAKVKRNELLCLGLNANSRLLAPDSSLSSIISTKGQSRNRTINGNFGVDFNYYLDTNTTLNFWLWATASHDSSTTDSRTERTEMEAQQTHGKKEPKKKRMANK